MTITAIKSICKVVQPEKEKPKVLGAPNSLADIGINILKSSNSMD